MCMILFSKISKIAAWLLTSVADAQSMTEFKENYGLPSYKTDMYMEYYNLLHGRVDKIEDFFFMAYRVLTEIEAGGLLMLPE